MSVALVVIGSVQTLIFFLQWRAFIAQKDAMNRQEQRLEDTIAEMQDQRDLAHDAASVELRAYVSVKGGGAFYQDRRMGFYFGGTPQLVNSGKTPAYHLSYWANADILERPLPKFQVLGPPDEIITHDAVLGGNGDGFSLGASIRHFVDDSLVDSIMRGTDDRALYVWGRIDYQDAFGVPHWTEFCQLTYFTKHDDGKLTVNVTFVEGRNKADQHGPLQRPSRKTA